MKRALQAAALLALTGIAVFLAWNHYDRKWLQSPIEGLVAPIVFEVPRGASLSSIARRLESQGMMDRPRSWVRHANREGLSTRLKAGEYRLQPGTSPAMLLDQFVAGDVILHTITLPEGWTFRQALAAIQSHPQVKSELTGLDDREILARLGMRDAHPEGLFFPDTYRFPRGTSDRDLLRQAHLRLESELAAAWARRAEGLPLESPYDALILASLVEKETGASEERPLIAGVFVNRLRKGMRL
ncbi:MAG TPA: endolytic transglycosylase MltG, partial [Steroidobacteraceae bacterium]|nr:endolytic transglycosylase MltG [Steroidobacteraceae bacterium]